MFFFLYGLEIFLFQCLFSSLTYSFIIQTKQCLLNSGHVLFPSRYNSFLQQLLVLTVFSRYTGPYKQQIFIVIKNSIFAGYAFFSAQNNIVFIVQKWLDRYILQAVLTYEVHFLRTVSKTFLE